jgi:hypothetical protein
MATAGSVLAYEVTCASASTAHEPRAKKMIFSRPFCTLTYTCQIDERLQPVCHFLLREIMSAVSQKVANVYFHTVICRSGKVNTARIHTSSFYL